MPRPKYPRNIYSVAQILQQQYRDFAHHNKKNPLNELLFIISSVKTTGPAYEKTYRSFRSQFPTFISIANASYEKLCEVLSTGGLQNVKAKSIQKIMSTLVKRYGRPTLTPLREMSDEDCEDFLLSFPGVGKKVARCVMMYSLHRKVFPVDTHCWLISKRLGWVKERNKTRTIGDKEMDELQDKIPPELRFSLHVNMVSLGKEYCTFHFPRCNKCPLNRCCRKVGVKRINHRPPTGAA